jgi:hypothetical protein
MAPVADSAREQQQENGVVMTGFQQDRMLRCRFLAGAARNSHGAGRKNRGAGARFLRLRELRESAPKLVGIHDGNEFDAGVQFIEKRLRH